MDFFELKIPPVAWTAMHAIAMWACRSYLPEFSFVFPGAFSLSFIFLLLGLFVLLAGVRSFSRSQTTVNPMNPEQSSVLVQSGIYQYTRNPMYLGMLLVLVAWFFHLKNSVAGVFLATFVTLLTRLQIIPEERVLDELFQETYRVYCARVPRWLGGSFSSKKP